MVEGLFGGVWYGNPGLISLVAAALLVAISVLMLRKGTRKVPIRLFAFFLLLIAGNATLDGVFKLMYEYQSSYPRGSPQLILLELQSVFLILDPGVLLYFSLVYPHRSRWADSRWTLPVLAGVWAGLVVLLLTDPIPTVAGASSRRTLILGYLAVCYGGSYGLMVARLRGEQSPRLLKQQTLLVGAFGIALVYRLGVLQTETVDLGLGPVPGLILPWLLIFSILAVAAVLSFRGTTRDQRDALRRAHAITCAGLLALMAVALLPYAMVPDWAVRKCDFCIYSSTAVFFLRWALFAVLGAYGILRYQVFDIAVHARLATEASLMALLAVAGVLAALVAGRALDSVLGGLSGGQVTLLAVVLVGLPWLVKPARELVRTRFPAPHQEADVEARRLEMYRASLEMAIDGGELPPQAEAELRSLRRDLGITDEQHRVILDIGRLERGRGPLTVRDSQGRLAGRYELGQTLGEGSHGRCRLARDALLGREVVVKEVPRLLEGSSHLDEARAAGRLNHPNIVTVHDVLELAGSSQLVMEHMRGGSLRGRLGGVPLATSEAVRLLQDVLAGLAAAHDRDIVHGDIKPENILLTEEGRAKLADFGSAYSTSPRNTFAALPRRPGPATLLYMAPEQVEGSPPTKASDLYAVAVVAHEMLVGRHYVETRGKTDFELMEAVVRKQPSLEGSELPPPLQAWLVRGLAKDPGQRWPDAATMATHLASAAGRASRIAPVRVPSRD